MRYLLLALLIAAPAHAADVWFAVHPQSGDAVYLTDQRGACPARALVARFEPAGKAPHTLGCYVEVDEVVYIIWADGDKGMVRKQALKRPVSA